MDILLKRKPSGVPIWLMRQAGRYLPEYLAIKEVIRSEGGDFLTMCLNPKIAAEITLQPINRFNGLNAAIIFSDILILPKSLGYEVIFKEKEGPQIVGNIIPTDRFINQDILSLVYEAISLVKAKLTSDVTLIGFAGSPLTVALYILLGQKINYNDGLLKNIFYGENKNILVDTIDLLVDATSAYLIGQIKAGAEVVKLFDSHAHMGTFSEEAFEQYVLSPNRRIIKNIKKDYPDIPIMFFPRYASHYYEKCMSIGADCLALDESLTPDFIKKLQGYKLPLQGNLDNALLCFGSKKEIEIAVAHLLEIMKDYPFIFNLGHGVLRQTPIENIEYLIKLVKNNY